MRVKTNELTGAALDWTVAKCEDLACEAFNGNVFLKPEHAVRSGNAMRIWRPSMNWAQGGPIIDREKISIWDASGVGHDFSWGAHITINCNHRNHARGDTPLIAAMRCYVASKLGDEVDVPEALL